MEHLPFTIKKAVVCVSFVYQIRIKALFHLLGGTQKNSRDLDQIPTTLKLFHCA